MTVELSTGFVGVLVGVGGTGVGVALPAEGGVQTDELVGDAVGIAVGVGVSLATGALVGARPLCAVVVAGALVVGVALVDFVVVLPVVGVGTGALALGVTVTL